MNEDHSTSRAYCEGCGTTLTPAWDKPCPKCGIKRKSVIVTPKALTLKLIVNSPDVAVTIIRKYYENNPILLFLNIVTTIASSAIGMVLTGPTGIAIGVFVGLALVFIMPPWKKEIKEIKHQITKHQ